MNGKCVVWMGLVALAVSTPLAAQQKTPTVWSKATAQQRRALSEEIGERGARQWAKSHGLRPIFDGSEKGLRQGPDQVYRGRGRAVHAVESKGGMSRVGRGYGFVQGSSEHAVKSAERVLSSRHAGRQQVRGSRAVLDAAARGRLQTEVVRTPHVQGRPLPSRVVTSVRTSDEARRLAQESLARIRNSQVRVGPAATKAALRSVVVVGAAVDASQRAQQLSQIETKFRRGQITQQQRETAHAANAAGLAGGWGGAAVGAQGGTAAGAMVGGPVGAGVGGVVGGVGGYVVGQAAAERAVTSSVKWMQRRAGSVRNAWQSVFGQ